MRPELLLGRQTRGGEGGRAEAARERARRASLVGTHALMQESVSFRRLGLVVIDEQHRFGVEQRAALIGKGAAPDVLLLTATPIPRSLALTLYGDLDVSTLSQRPPGRGTVRTAVRGASQREQVMEFVREECERGPAGVRRAAGDRGVRAGRSARGHHDGPERSPRAGPSCDVGLVHGRLKAEERDDVMRRFRAGELHVLVATTVIEVGYRRAQRHDHADRASRALRTGAAAPAPRADRAGGGGELLHSPGATDRAPIGCEPSRRRRTGSGSRSWIWRSGGWAT